MKPHNSIFNISGHPVHMTETDILLDRKTIIEKSQKKTELKKRISLYNLCND